MIARLRRKFILINMACVLVVLLVVFGAILATSIRQTRSDGDVALRAAIGREIGMPPERFAIGGGKPHGKDFGKPMWLQPVFTVTVEKDSGVRVVDSGNVDVSDETIAEAMEAAIAAEADEGTLTALNLRYLRETTMRGERYAFLDMSVGQASTTRLVFMLLLVGLGGLAAFFVISLFLSGWALAPVKRAWAQQQQFVADASHELKTPLTVILANLGIIGSHLEETVASQAQWLSNTREEATRMRSLVDGLLFLAKTDAMQPPREWGAFSLSDALWRCVLSFEPVAYEAGVRLESEIDPGVAMTGDEGQIAQLVGILLDNACKYAGEGGEASIRLWQGQDRLHIAVRNTGEAISPDALAHVFERFYRADQSRARAQGGYGLGLSIAAEIVRQHGGKIAASSDAEIGTTFTVTLPQRK